MTKAKFLLFALFAVVGFSFVTILVLNIATGDEPDYWPWDPRAKIAVTCRKHVREAEQKAAQAMVRRSSEFSDFINSRKAGAKPFAKDMISCAGMWLAVKPYLPFTDKEGHKKYVMEKFDQHIFTNEALADALERAINGSTKDLDGIENELAVVLRKEIGGQSLPPDQIKTIDAEKLKAIDRMVSVSQRDVAREAGNEITPVIAEFILPKVLVYLGASTGILAARAVNTWWTCGAGIIINIAADSILKWFYDPASDIEREMVTSLDKLSLDASTAIRFEMYKVISQRSELWNKTVAEILP